MARLVGRCRAGQPKNEPFAITLQGAAGSMAAPRRSTPIARDRHVYVKYHLERLVQAAYPLALP
jgi:hypothetical protein